MMTIRRLFIGLVLSLSMLFQGSVLAESAESQVTDATASTEHLSPLAAHPRTSLSIVDQLRHHHYVSKALDDSESSAVFDKYLEMLDGTRAYFLASDVQAVEKYRYELDDALKRGNLQPAFELFNRFQDRLVERLHFLLSELNKGLDSMDFSTDEVLELDREHSPWPSTLAEQNELWRKRLKASVLAMKLNGKELPEIQEVLTKRYTNRLKQAKKTKSEDAFQLYVNAFAATYDPHTQYFSPRNSENFNINMSLSLEGIGAVLSTEDDYTSVVRLVPAGPADKTGNIKPADRIIGVAQGANGQFIDVVGWRLDDVVELIRGPKGSLVRLEVIPADGEESDTRVVDIVRNTVQLEEQSAQKKLITMTYRGQERKIGVIDIPTFYVDFKGIQQGDPNYKSTTRDVRKLIEELKQEGAEGLVIDLRNNGGGSLQEADSLTGLFIKSGPTVQVKTANRRANVYSDTDESVSWEGPMAVLVNRLSASASEIFAGAIQDYGRGLIIGSQTFGKGTVQTLIPLNRGQLKMTQAKFYRVSGQSTQHQGVIPDLEYPELYDTDEIGESSLEDALPWDVIKPAVYPHSEEIQPLLPTLQSRHLERIKTDPDFQYLTALAVHSHLNRSKTTLSLNEQVRRQEKAREDAWRLDLENTLRIAKGLEPAASLEALEEIEKAAVKAQEAAEADDQHDGTGNKEVSDGVHEDALINETAAVLLDYLGLTRQVAMSEPVADPESGSEVKTAMNTPLDSTATTPAATGSGLETAVDKDTTTTITN